MSSAGRRTSAQLWLRRAIQLAPNDALKDRAAQDLRYVRAQNPWSTSYTFSIAPSSNINNGSRNETSELFDLPFEFELGGEARALSGVEFLTGLRTQYRVVSNSRKRTDLLLGLSHRTYTLSDEAKKIAPDVDGSDFATSSIYVGLQENYALSSGKAQLGWDFGIGRTWYGGDPLFDYTRIGASFRRAAGPRGLLDLSLRREGQDGQNGRDDATIWTARVGYGMALGNGDRLLLSLGGTDSRSDGDYLDYTQREIAARYSLAKPVGPAQLDFGLSYSDKRHDESSLTSDGRQEHSVQATVTAALPELDFYGFIPTLTFNAERTEANIDLYETETYGVQLGIRSAF
ncbi:hypothetical protein [Marivita sp. S2033]|uniref:hypothetical protein n=1 Tax=Marivita sp. S2033 TaxID=3373187 RepID=UPI003981E27A